MHIVFFLDWTLYNYPNCDVLVLSQVFVFLASQYKPMQDKELNLVLQEISFS